MAELTEICAYVKNHFYRVRNKGTFTLTSGVVPLDTLLEEQYFQIIGSALNDGVYQNTAESLANLRDETFSGVIWTMGVPPAFEKLCEEINEWQETNGTTASENMSPFNSESFGGYSYSKSSGSTDGNGSAVTWQSQFAKRLMPWRKVAE